MRISTDTATAKQRVNPLKPMEDSIISNPDIGLFGICDGGTRVPFDGSPYPNPSPAAEGSRLFAETVLTAFERGMSPTKENLCEALALANQELGKLRTILVPEVNYYENDLIEVSGVFGLVCGSSLYVASLGDSPGYLFRSTGEVLDLNTSMTAKVMPLVEEWSKSIGLWEARIKIRKSIRNRPEAPERFGIFTGEEICLQLLECREFQLRAGDTVLITSDGIPPEVARTLHANSAQEIIRAAEAAVDIANGAIKEDDKAVIKISVKL